MELTIIVLIIMITVGIVGVGSRFVLKKGPDNKIEEAAEKIIKKHLDIDIDLSPDTPDPDNNYPDDKKAKDSFIDKKIAAKNVEVKKVFKNK